MPGTMSRADLVADLKASLQDAASVFTAADDGDFKRHLNVAALDMGRKVPRTLRATLTLTADVDEYAAPVDLLDFSVAEWDTLPDPWAAHYPGPLPRVMVAEIGGARSLVFDPAPTAQQIAVLGPTLKYRYRAAHAINDAAASTTVPAGHRGLLLLRAQAEAMREMAMRNIGKPVTMRDGFSQTPRNGTPAALYRTLLAEFLEAA